MLIMVDCLPHKSLVPGDEDPWLPLSWMTFTEGAQYSLVVGEIRL